MLTIPLHPHLMGAPHRIAFNGQSRDRRGAFAGASR
jgi:hypothetical protein